jgi:hypothetical protein
LYNYYGVPESLAELVEAEAVRAGNRARMLMELEEGQEATRRSVRRRLASTLVQLGVRLDPLAAEDLNDEVA